MSLGDALNRVKQARNDGQFLHPLLTEGLESVEEKELFPDMWLGPSRLPELCIRAYTIAWRLGLPLVRQFDAQSKWNMDAGTALHTMFQDQWLGPLGWLYGGWECPTCLCRMGCGKEHVATVETAIACPEKCPSCGNEPGWRSNFRYVEPTCIDPILRVRGFTDGLLRLPAQPEELFDLKTTGDLKWVRDAPRINDVTQLNWYLDMAGMTRGRIVYVSRGAKKFEDAMVEHVVYLDADLMKQEKEKVRGLREALKAPKSEPSVPACQYGGRGTYGPCDCTQLDLAWARHGP